MFVRLKNAANAFIRDKHGTIAVWQTPNIPLGGWFVLMVAAYFIPAGGVKTGLHSLSSAFLFTWSYLEITSGVSPFRRVLGGVVLIGVLAGFFL